MLGTGWVQVGPRKNIRSKSLSWAWPDEIVGQVDYFYDFFKFFLLWLGFFWVGLGHGWKWWSEPDLTQERVWSGWVAHDQVNLYWFDVMFFLESFQTSLDIQ